MNAAEQHDALLRAREGDRDALGALLDGFRPYLNFLLRGATRSGVARRLDIADLVQEAYQEAVRSFPQFQGASVAEWTAWLRQVALRTARRVLRGHLDASKRSAHAEEPDDAALDGVADPGSSPSDQAVRHEQSAQMARALATLPEEMQQVLLARHVDEVPYADLATRLARSEGAVRVLYTRALRRLRQACQSTEEG